MNSIHVISPYKWKGMWVFDDPSVGLKREPFVAGADVVIDLATQGISGAEEGFLLLFSSSRFPGSQLKLELMEAGDHRSGNVYMCRNLNITAWLCPALYKYFKVAPARIHAEFRPIVGMTKTKQHDSQVTSSYESKTKKSRSRHHSGRLKSAH